MPVFQLSDKLIFPPVRLADKSGLLAIGGDLSPDRLVLAYQNGIFPWYGDDDPICWWSPDPRFVLFPRNFHMSDRFARFCRKSEWRVTINQNFTDVIQRCSSVLREEEGTWILPEMKAAYEALFHKKWVHSVEVWDNEDLVGGLYGVWIGSVFCGESMFHTVSEASKIALLALVVVCLENKVEVIDCQVPSQHLRRMGATDISRKDFISYLSLSDTDKGRYFRSTCDILSYHQTSPMDLWDRFQKETK